MRTLLDPADRAEVLQRIMSIRPHSVRLWGSLLAGEMVCHLADALQTMPRDRAADDSGTLLTRTVLWFVALTAPVCWPTGVKTFPEIDQEVSRGGWVVRHFTSGAARP